MEYLVICLIAFQDGTMREFQIPASTYADAIAIMDAELYVSEHRPNERGEICEISAKRLETPQAPPARSR